MTINLASTSSQWLGCSGAVSQGMYCWNCWKKEIIVAAISFSSVGRNPIAEGLDAVAVPLKWAISMQEYSYRYTRYNHNNKMEALELEYSYICRACNLISFNQSCSIILHIFFSDIALSTFHNSNRQFQREGESCNIIGHHWAFGIQRTGIERSDTKSLAVLQL